MADIIGPTSKLGEALDLDPDDDRQRIRQAVTSARKGLLERHGRALIPDRGTGHRHALTSRAIAVGSVCKAGL